MSNFRKQEQQSLDPKKYENRILISSTVSGSSDEGFSDDIISLINNYDNDILFLSCNRTDHEKWIVDWCAKHSYPCKIIEFNPEHPMNGISDACLLSSEIIIFTHKSEYPYTLYTAAAKKNKLHMTTIIVK